MNHANPWRGEDMWQDFAMADAERDYAASDVDMRLAVMLLAERREHEQAQQLAYAGAADEARQARMDRWLDWALLAVFVVIWCLGVVALGFCAWSLVTLR